MKTSKLLMFKSFKTEESTLPGEKKMLTVIQVKSVLRVFTESDRRVKASAGASF